MNLYVTPSAEAGSCAFHRLHTRNSASPVRLASPHVIRKVPIFQGGTLAVPRQPEAVPAVTVWNFMCTTGAQEQGEVTTSLLCHVLKREDRGSIPPQASAVSNSGEGAQRAARVLLPQAGDARRGLGQAPGSPWCPLQIVIGAIGLVRRPTPFTYAATSIPPRQASCSTAAFAGSSPPSQQDATEAGDWDGSLSRR